MSVEEIAAVRVGIAEFAKRKFLTEEQFENAINRFMELRRIEIEKRKV